jgi:hypothetical protein
VALRMAMKLVTASGASASEPPSPSMRGMSVRSAAP